MGEIDRGASMQLPEIVGAEEWERANDALIAKEKAHTRARDALAAERRRQPMTEIPSGFEFEGADGVRTLAELFDGRPQLLLYHFWHPPGGNPCSGCSMFTDQVGRLEHINARDLTFALVSTAPQSQIQPFRERMDWQLPWYTVIGDDFQTLRGTTEYFKLDVYVREGDRVFLTYSTSSRGVEALGSVWTFLDLTPLARQEEWEDTPPGRPQTPPYGWWRLHDEYGDGEAS
jgi:predicted dithiol-disulfide oxidoreductase (DUF899 family)